MSNVPNGGASCSLHKNKYESCELWKSSYGTKKWGGALIPLWILGKVIRSKECGGWWARAFFIMKHRSSFGKQCWRPALRSADLKINVLKCYLQRVPPGHLLAAVSGSKEASGSHKAILITGMLSVHIYASVFLSEIMDLTGRMC